MVALGESTTAGGWSSCRERSWPHQLARLLNEFQRVPVQLQNVGIGANLISTKSPAYPRSGKPAATERLDKHVIAHKPDLLVISYGLNDARGGTPVDLFCDEMKWIVETVRKAVHPLIVLLGPYYMTVFAAGGPVWSHAGLALFDRFNEAIERVAAQCDCLFVELLSAYGRADRLVHEDGRHANDLGHRIVADKIFELLASNCSLPRARSQGAGKADSALAG